MTPARRPLSLESVEDRCVPSSGFRPMPVAGSSSGPGSGHFAPFRVSGDDGGGDDRRGRRGGRSDVTAVRVVELREVEDIKPTAVVRAMTEAVPVPPPILLAARAAATAQVRPTATAELREAPAEPRSIPAPPRQVVEREAVPPPQFVSTTVPEPTAPPAARDIPTSTAVPRIGSADAATAPPVVVTPTLFAVPPRDLVEPPAATPVTSPQTLVVGVVTAEPTAPEAADPPPVVAPQPTPAAVVVAAAQEAVTAAVAPLLPLAGVVPIDLVAVEQAAAELLAQLTDPASEWTTAGRWGWLGAAVLAAGGLAHAARPAADRRRTAPPGADSALARWESRHVRR